MSKEYTYFDENGKEIVTIREPIEDVVLRFAGLEKHIAELEITITQAKFQNNAKDKRIEELEKDVKKYKQYKGLFSVCSRHFIQALDKIEELEQQMKEEK